MTSPRVRLAKLLAIIILGLSGVLVGPAVQAFAHAQLLSSSPAGGAILATPPDRITLTFGENVEISLGAIRLFDGAGKQVEIGTTEHPNGDRTIVSATLPPLGDGSYVVDWQVISADSHQVHAAYSFQIGDRVTLQPGVIEAAIARSGTGRAAGGALAVARGLLAAGFAVVLGTFALLTFGIVSLTKRLRRAAIIAAAAAVVAGLVAIPLEAGYAANRSLTVLTDSTAWSAVLGTQVGHDWLLRTALIGVGAAVFLVTAQRCGSRVWQLGLAIWAIGVGLTFAYGGHGHTGRWLEVGVIATVVHVLAISVWLGGLVALILALQDVDERQIRRFSQVALLAVIVLVVSGTIQGVRQLGSFNALTSTRYGQLLTWKVIAVALVLFVASLSRRTVHGRILGLGAPRPQSVGAAAVSLDKETLRRAVTVEVIFGALILAITSVLMAANPVAAGGYQPFSATLTQDAYVASVSFDPARVGSNQIHVYLSQISGSLVNPDNVTIELSDPSRNVAAIEVPVSPAGPSHYVAVAELPYQATWRMKITARYNTFDQVIFTTPVRVRG